MRYIALAVLALAVLAGCASGTSSSAPDYSQGNYYTCQEFGDGTEVTAVDVSQGIETAGIPETDGASPQLRRLVSTWPRDLDRFQSTQASADQQALKRASDAVSS